VEVLVVISTIILLLSILLPVCGRARRQAKLITCRLRLRQNYLSLDTYAASYDGYWPKVDYNCHTDRFFAIASPQCHGPLYYLWLAGFVSAPQSWYCPAGKVRFCDNWQRDNQRWQPRVGAQAGYQYRMRFAYYWPGSLCTAAHRPKSPSSGHLRPADHRALATWVDAFGSGSGSGSGHHNNWNVLYNDGCVKNLYDNRKIIPGLDLSWHQAGDWRIELAPGVPDSIHNVAFLWHFFDGRGFTFDGKTPQ